MKKYIYQTVIFGFLVYTVLTISCQKLDPVAVTKFCPPENVSAVSYNSAIVKGEFMDVGDEVSSYGHCWATASNPTIQNFKTSFPGKPKKQVEFTSELKGLTGNTKYYVRTYAITNVATIYGKEVYFNTIEAPYITITSPKGGDHFIGPQEYTITWTDNINENVKIELYKGGIKNEEIINSTESDGTYDWGLGQAWIDSQTSFGNDYTIKISSVTNAGITNESALFTISEPTDTLGTMTDIDANSYTTIKIGTQWWMKENLKTTKYSDNTAIAYPGADNNAWGNNTTGAYAWYNNDIANKTTYGALYSWHAVNTGKLCPAGWHVPNYEEWSTMEVYLQNNRYNYDGSVDTDNDRATNNKIAKSLAAITNWTSSTKIGAVGNTDYPFIRDLSKFTALPGGYRHSNGFFYFVGDIGLWWSFTEYNVTDAWYRSLFYDNSEMSVVSSGKVFGLSVRCVRD
jgi:uncharacterized protein (TIGR02145 family)